MRLVHCIRFYSYRSRAQQIFDGEGAHQISFLRKSFCHHGGNGKTSKEGPLWGREGAECNYNDDCCSSNEGDHVDLCCTYKQRKSGMSGTCVKGQREHSNKHDYDSCACVEDSKDVYDFQTSKTRTRCIPTCAVKSACDRDYPYCTSPDKCNHCYEGKGREADSCATNLDCCPVGMVNGGYTDMCCATSGPYQSECVSAVFVGWCDQGWYGQITQSNEGVSE